MIELLSIPSPPHSMDEKAEEQEVLVISQRGQPYLEGNQD